MSTSNQIDGTAASADDIVEAYGLSILKEPADWREDESGNLDLTKDGDPVLGDVAYNGLFRLVEMWRYNETHFRYLFDTTRKMIALHAVLDERASAIVPTSPREFLQLAPTLGAIMEDQRVAASGSITYSGCLLLILSGALLRLKDDLGAMANEWKTTGPLFNSQSVGSIVEASANGFRHADEWAKTRPPTDRQRRSQDILDSVLGSDPLPEETSPGRCVEVQRLLSSGGDFEALASNIFAFAHNLALKVRKRAA